MSPTNLLSTWTHQVNANGESGPMQIRLSKELILSLKSTGRIRQWRRGQTVVQYGQAVSNVSICLSGQFSVLLNSIDGHSQLLRYMVEGELYGVPSAFANAPFPTDLLCVQDGSTLDIPKAAFEARLRRDPDFAIALIQNLSSRVAELFSLMEADLLPSLRARVYQALRRLAMHHGRSKKSGDLNLNLSQGDIASAVHASRQKVHQELKKMESDGLLQLGYRSITLHERFFEE